MTRRLVVTVSAALLFAACTSSPSPTIAPPTRGPTSEPTTSAVATVPAPSPLITVTCGPLDPDVCQSAVTVVSGRWPPEMDPIVTITFRPMSARLTCPSSGGLAPTAPVCGVVAMVTTAGGPVDFGLVLSGAGWSRSGATHGWWGTDGTSFCVPAANYRLGGRVGGIGSCAGLLGDPAAPSTITLAVGQEIDLHMTVIPASESPHYSLPWSTAPAIVDQAAVLDAATATYLALSPGTAVLWTTGPWCMTSTPTGVQEGMAPCPLAKIHVVPTR
jgi:hypothetical protein